ncbi:hypothetical protein MSMEG_3971 [Mycolicibacterium smegmatis MC2 155]|uniref:Uncharacterized protein n=1 Tax=Mycolicibacterium smegmatis (strain ATCC 700084 / mc(2)155) TaxID=246196 RepID=A0QZB9_MYCS2|nr:hypothetical protein MSMEG_3971 [Mycolicibacterium smegmatis MC2 155]
MILAADREDLRPCPTRRGAVRRGLQQAEPREHRQRLRHSQIQRRQRMFPQNRIPAGHTMVGIDGHPGELKGLNVALDRALRHPELLGDPGGRQRFARSAQQINQRVQPFGSPHAVESPLTSHRMCSCPGRRPHLADQPVLGEVEDVDPAHGNLPVLHVPQHPPVGAVDGTRHLGEHHSRVADAPPFQKAGEALCAEYIVTRVRPVRIGDQEVNPEIVAADPTCDPAVRVPHPQPHSECRIGNSRVDVQRVRVVVHGTRIRHRRDNGMSVFALRCPDAGFERD